MPVEHADPEQTARALSVGLLTWALPPEKSGLSRAALEIAQALAGAGADVRVFTLDRRRSERDGAVEIIGCGIADRSGVGAWRRRMGAGHLAAPFVFRRAVMREHRRRRFDVIEATNWYAPGAMIAIGGGIPLVTRNSTPVAISLAQEPTWRNRIDGWAARTIERMAAQRSAALISNTAAHGETIARLYDVDPPGPRHAVIGLSLPAALCARGQHATYPAAAAPVELLFVGRNEPRKGFDALLDAIGILAADAIPAFRITLVGIEDADLAAASAAARACIEPRHRVSEVTLFDLFERAHIVVAPSRYESFGLVYQEAMMFGRPVVACAEDASARLFVGDSGAGPLASACTGAAIAAALRPLIVDPSLRQRHAAAARAAAGQFTRARLGDETLRLYRSAIGSNARSSRSSSSRRAPSAVIAP